MKKLTLLPLAALALTFAVLPSSGQDDAKEAGNDWILIPERRAGPITGEWTGGDLVKAFGSRNCKREDIPVGEGETETGYRIYAGTDDEIEVMISPGAGKVDRVVIRLRFEDLKNAAGEWIGSRVVPRKSRWRSTSGITLGSTIADVEKVNGGPFRIEGWEIDCPGAVNDWKGGKIPQGFHARFMYKDQEAYGKWWEKVTEAGGKPFDGLSTNAGIRGLNPTVYHLTVDL